MGTPITLVSGVTGTFNTDDDLEVVGKFGMFSNNQVILKGEVSVRRYIYSFHGNTTSRINTIFLLVLKSKTCFMMKGLS